MLWRIQEQFEGATPELSPEQMGTVLAILGTFLLVFLFVSLLYYIYSSLVLMSIARKTNTDNSWLAWIPIGNLYLMTQVAKVSWLFMFVPLAAFFLVLVPIVGLLLMLAVVAVWAVWLWWKICEARGKPGWFSLLIAFVPVVGLVMMGIVAWSD